MTPSEEGPTRVCRKCSVASSATGDYCPSCGTSYARRSRRPSRKAVIVVTAVALLAGGTGTAVAVVRRQDAIEQRRAEAADKRAANRAAREAAEAQQAADDAERSSRRDLVQALEKRITKHAKGLVEDDLLEGPIKYSSCTATGGGSTDDLTALTGTFECMAVNEENGDGTVSGYTYSGTAEWETGAISWKLGD